MERLTTNYYGRNQIIACSNEMCDETCNKYEDCRICPISKAINKLAAYEDAEEAANNKRMIDIDIWIDKLSKIVSDPDAPGEYKYYCMHFINEIETEFRAQEVQAMQEDKQ